MRYSTKLLGLMAATVLMVPAFQMPGFSQDPRHLAAAEPLLQVDGVLEPGDASFTEDNSLYDNYTFEATAGQAVVITLESTEFDPYLLLQTSAGDDIAQNDDSSDNTRNAAIAVVLPTTGTYQVLANAYDATGRGAYRLTVTLTLPNDPVVRRFEADELNRQGLELLNAARYLEALELFEQALAIFQETSVREVFPEESRNGEGAVLNNIGRAYKNLGQYETALTYYQDSLTISQEVGNRSMEDTTLHNIGLVYDSLGQYEVALTY